MSSLVQFMHRAQEELGIDAAPGPAEELIDSAAEQPEDGVQSEVSLPIDRDRRFDARALMSTFSIGRLEKVQDVRRGCRSPPRRQGERDCYLFLSSAAHASLPLRLVGFLHRLLCVVLHLALVAPDQGRSQPHGPRDLDVVDR